MQYHQSYHLAEWTSWKIGGTADWAVLPTSVEEIQRACRWAQAKNLPITVLSGGSNVLVSDQGIEGLTILLKDFNQIELTQINGNKLQVVCQSGVTKADLLKVFIKQRMSPAIFLAGLPGDVGGGVVMNAGVGHDVAPKEFCEIVEWVEWIDTSQSDFPLQKKKKAELQWMYRKCTGWQPGIITRVGIAWEEAPDETVLKRLQEGNKRRMSTQPLQWPSCGSVFKNPPGNKSGRLIEECGLKGYQVGGAQVSEKHANFIINVGGATANDIEAVRAHVQDVVKKQKGISLETEYVFLGRR
ncbi:UDP-N-acetylmuramate dehydrogenase [bacterium]|nr:UDP-N-acetylmuramate dehydrogenase [bacterium]